MAYFAKASKSIVIKASRETIGLVVGASAMAFAIAYAVHSKPMPTAASAPPQQVWTGDLAELQPSPAPATQILTSADLVVPKAQLALPAMAAHPLVKRACDDPSCVKVPVPPHRIVARTETPGMASQPPKSGLLSTLNPLNHLPPMSTVSRPFTYAGDVVSGWIKRF